MIRAWSVIARKTNKLPTRFGTTVYRYVDNDTHFAIIAPVGQISEVILTKTRGKHEPIMTALEISRLLNRRGNPPPPTKFPTDFRSTNG